MVRNFVGYLVLFFQIGKCRPLESDSE